MIIFNLTGEEMTHYTMNLILDAWIRPHIDIEHWKFYDLSCAARDATNDKVLAGNNFTCGNFFIFFIDLFVFILIC